jgi:hypothetical protein
VAGQEECGIAGSTALSNASSVSLNACRVWFSATSTEAELLRDIAHGAGVVDRLLQFSGF